MKHVTVVLTLFLVTLTGFAPHSNIEYTKQLKREATMLKMAKNEELRLFKQLQHAPLTKDNLLKYLILNNIESPEIVLKQAILESNHFKSNLCVNHNSLFGMHLPNSRKTVNIGFVWGDVGRKSKMCKYNSWQQSVDDYKLWVDMHKDKDKSNYYQFLINTGYCELGGDYIDLLKTIKI